MKSLIAMLAMFFIYITAHAQYNLQPTMHFTGESTVSMTGISANSEPSAPEVMSINVENNEIDNIRIFPNSAEAEIICVFPQVTNWNVVVCDTRGNTIEQLKGFDAASFYVNMLDYQPGIYIIRITDNNNKQKCVINVQKIY